MHSLEKIEKIPYEAEFIKDIILDIEKYPDFLPWCSSAIIMSKNEYFTTAKLEISFKGFSESYISKIFEKKDNDSFTIEVEAISGPFKYLNNKWVIKKQNNMSEVHFFIDFECKSKILDAVIGIFLKSATGKMVDAFEKRARFLSGSV